MNAPMGHRMRRPALALQGCTWACLLLLAGCGNLSGVGGDSKYACKAPEGVACDSVSGTYANALHNNLPSQRARAADTAPAVTQPSGPTATTSDAGTPARRVPLTPAITASIPAMTGANTGQDANPLRSQARILRLWIKPWEDTDGDLYDQGFVYVQVSNGQWMIDHVQRQIREGYAPLRPPPKANSVGVEPGAGLSTEASTGQRTSPVSGAFSPVLRPTPSPTSTAPTSFNRVQ